jgi:hypothetical protein
MREIEQFRTGDVENHQHHEHLALDHGTQLAVGAVV